jgi:hypothetical protein
MSINRAEQLLQQKLPNKIRDYDRELRALKTRQLFGADNIVIEPQELIEVTAALDSFQDVIIEVPLIPENPIIVQSELLWSLFIDVDGDPDYSWPNGSALTTNQKFSTRLEWHPDLATSDDNTGKRNHIIWLQNASQGSNLWTYYLKARFYVPKVRFQE